MVSFDVSPEDHALIDAIVERAFIDLALPKAVLSRRRKYFDMDLTATHANGCRLRLADLLAANQVNFAHDINGITACLDRRTGKLTRNFWPRFACPASEQD